MTFRTAIRNARAFVAVVALSALAGQAPGQPNFIAQARVSARPDECGGARRTTPTLWDRARVPSLDGYCGALAVGYASLDSAPGAALDASSRADRLLPGRAAAATLAARADVRLGAFPRAWASFEKALGASPPQRLESPGALHDLAIAALSTGHPSAAMNAYRALIPRLSLLDDLHESRNVLVESGALSMSLGPLHLSECIGYLTDARHRMQSLGASDYVLAALALAESRRGHTGDASALVAEASGPWRLESDRAHPAQARDRPVLPAGELDAMIALLAEARDPELSLSAWDSFLSSPAGKGPYAEHARTHRAAVLRGKRR